MNGITYFRLNSPYEGDVTKNCGLTGAEVDSNFFVLEGRDIKSVRVEGDTLYITLLNGDVVSANGAFEGYTKDLDVSFDKDNGVLTISHNGQTKEIDGFLTKCECDCPEGDISFITVQAATDPTLVGGGTTTNPLGLSPAVKTGHYKSVISFIDTANGGTLPDVDIAARGDRYLITQSVSEYGLLYDYRAVRQIACDLTAANSEWRIPTKEDWDDMLNAIEPDEDFRNHDNTCSNQYLGKYAGKFLKSENYWREYQASGGNDTDMGEECNCGYDRNCSPMYCGEYSTCRRKQHSSSPAGVDKYGFNALPAGYGDDGGILHYFGERAAFWTASSYENCSSAFMKRLSYERSDVYQDMIPSTYRLSIRLVKDYNGINFYGKDEVLGEAYDTVLMPSLSSGNKVWTSVNLALTNPLYEGVVPNNGQDLLNTTVYYIVEWDGTKWLSTPFVEGDMVTILNAPNGKYNSDYKLVHNELVCVRDMIAGDVIEEVTVVINNLDDRLEAEIERATNRENELEEQINNLGQGLSNDITDLSDRLQAEIDRSTARDNEQQGMIDDLNDRLQAEINRATGAEDTLEQYIAAEANRAIATEQELDDNTIIRAEYDGGLLTLIKKGAEENANVDNVSVALTFNFGEIDDLNL